MLVKIERAGQKYYRWWNISIKGRQKVIVHQTKTLMKIVKCRRQNTGLKEESLNGTVVDENG